QHDLGATQMCTVHYFFTDAENRKRGPFSGPEIATLMEQQVLSPETPVSDDRGESLAAGDLAQRVRAKRNEIESIPLSPPALPSGASRTGKDKAARSPLALMPRRGFLAWVAVMAVFHGMRILFRHSHEPKPSVPVQRTPAWHSQLPRPRTQFQTSDSPQQNDE